MQKTNAKDKYKKQIHKTQTQDQYKYNCKNDTHQVWSQEVLKLALLLRPGDQNDYGNMAITMLIPSMMVIMMLVVIVIIIVSTAGQTVKGTGVVGTTKGGMKSCSKVKRTLEEECSSLKVKVEEIKQEQAHNSLCFFLWYC